MEAPIAEIRPNIKKAFILNILIVGSIVLLVVIMLVILHTLVGLDIFLDVFTQLGFEISTTALLSYSIFGIIFVTGLLLILNYITLGKIRYTLYPDKITYSKSFFILHIHDKEVPYTNITKIVYQKKPFLNTAKIVFELSGMKEKTAEVDFIDDAEEVIQKIHDLIRDYRARYYANYAQEYKYQNIMDKF